jgi:hypothetical protein
MVMGLIGYDAGIFVSSLHEVHKMNILGTDHILPGHLSAPSTFKTTE